VTEPSLRDAVAASSLAGEDAHRDLLESVVETARTIFRARAASITLYDEQADRLVFRSVAGEGSEDLVGQSFPAGEGIAGFVLRSREPLVVEDVTADPRFGRRVAESTGYVPKGLMAVPLLRGDRVLGVLSVLDRPQNAVFTLAEMDLLTLFGRQAAVALDIVERARSARAMLDGQGEGAELAEVAQALDGLEGARRDAAIRLLRALRDLLGDRGSDRAGDGPALRF
jgi:GAF domain-containing protein